MKRLRLPWFLLALVVGRACGGRRGLRRRGRGSGTAAAPSRQSRRRPSRPPAETGAADTGATDTGATPPPAGITIGLVSDIGGVERQRLQRVLDHGLEQRGRRVRLRDACVRLQRRGGLPAQPVQPQPRTAHALVFAVGFLTTPDTVTARRSTRTRSSRASTTSTATRRTARRAAPACSRTPRPDYPTEEAGYVAGIVAAMMTESATVSTVGGAYDPAGGQLDRRLPAGGLRHEARGRGPGRVLGRLRRSGSVQGDRARPHLAGRRRRLPGGRSLRAWRARRRLIGRGVWRSASMRTSRSPGHASSRAR